MWNIDLMSHKAFRIHTHILNLLYDICIGYEMNLYELKLEFVIALDRISAVMWKIKRVIANIKLTPKVTY